MMNVLTPSKKTVESLGKITDEYVKGWNFVEMIPEIRYRYCLLTDKLGAKWLDVLLEFSQLSVEKRTEWLNGFMHNWSHANGSDDYDSEIVQDHVREDHGHSNHNLPRYNREEEDFSRLDGPAYQKIGGEECQNPKEESMRDSLEGDRPEENTGTTAIAKDIKQNTESLDSPPIPLPKQLPSLDTEQRQHLKRGRSDEEIEYAHHEEIEDEKEMHKRVQWGMVKNVQLMGSIRFELCKKCGMKEDCLKIAQQMDDREKIVESRLMSGDADGEELNNAMNSLLHL